MFPMPGPNKPFPNPSLGSLPQGPKSQPGPGMCGKKSKILGMGRLGQAPGRKQLPEMELPPRPPPLRAPRIPPRMSPNPPPLRPPPCGNLSSGPSSRTYSKKVTPFILKGIAATKPVGSTEPVGLFETYPYRFKDWGLPISALPRYGSGDKNRPHLPASKRARA